jgi:hypothetical protein
VTSLVLVLRLVHIVSGTFWVGTVMAGFFFVEPTATALGAPGGRFMTHLLMRQRLNLVLVAAAVVTAIAGALLYWIDSAGLRTDWIATPTGLAFTVGAIAGLGAIKVVFVFLRPAVQEIAELAKDPMSTVAPYPLERVRRWGLVEVGFLFIAVAAMATARYLGS